MKAVKDWKAGLARKYYVCVKMIFSTVCKNVIIHDMLLSMIGYKGEGFQVNPLEARDSPLVFSPWHHHVCEITNFCHDLPHPFCSYIYSFSLSLGFNSKHEEGGGGKREDWSKKTKHKIQHLFPFKNRVMITNGEFQLSK